MWLPVGVARLLWSLVGVEPGGPRPRAVVTVPASLHDFVAAVARATPPPAGWQPLRVDARLAQEVIREVIAWWPAGAGTAEDHRREVAARVAADFAAWRVVLAERWLLSRTEVGLQLLSDLLHRSLLRAG
jgi:hypothetical protein